MKKTFLVLFFSFLISCAPALVTHNFGTHTLQGPQTETFSAVIKALAGLGYTVDFADEKAGVINTGWYSYNVQRGMSKVSWGLQSRALITIADTGQVNLKFETQAAYGSALGAQYWQPLYDGDEPGIKAAESEYQRVKSGLDLIKK